MSEGIARLVTRKDSCTMSVVERLEEALEQARTGEIVAVGIAAVRPNNAVSTSWSDSENLEMLVGASAILQAKLAKLAIE